jgi:hypothetical protein
MLQQHTARCLQECFLWQAFLAGSSSHCSGCLAASTAASAVQLSVLLCGAYSTGLNKLEWMPLN